MTTDVTSHRRTGMEQEFFLVDEKGIISERSDEFLSLCRQKAEAEGLDAGCYSEECSMSMVEIRTNPADSLEGLEREYLANVGLAVRAGKELGLRLYPLATYPLPMSPVFREEARYSLQIHTIGEKRFLDAGRCVGVHLHIEAPDGVIDDEEVIRQDAPADGLREVLDLYNLATALDPALISLTRACPFYEGKNPGLAARTAFYRGSGEFGWDGVYTELPQLGSLHPYALSAADIVDRQLEGYEAWLSAMEEAGVGGRLPEMSGGILDVCWRPVRVSGQGTVEIRGIDGNHPEAIMSVAALVRSAAERIRREGLTVEPAGDLMRFEVEGTRLLVPDFETIGGRLLYLAVTEGTESAEIRTYLDSIIAFANPEETDERYISRLKDPDGSYRSSERDVLERLSGAPDTGSPLDREKGLKLVREACDALEERLAVGKGIAAEG